MNVNIMNVKTRLIAVVSAGAVSWLALNLSHTAVAQMRENYQPQPKNEVNPNQVAQKGRAGSTVAKQITPEEAAKKYPTKNGKYPIGETDPHKASGLVSSPYPPHTEFDCSQVPRNGLVLDTHVNKVFVRP